jgi:hypothetical protein
MFSKARQFDEIKEGQDYKIVSVKTLKVGTKKDPNKVINFDDSTDILFVREKICLLRLIFRQSVKARP